MITRAPGYLLEVGDNGFDVLRFEHAVETGRSQLAAGEADAAADACCETGWRYGGVRRMRSSARRSGLGRRPSGWTSCASSPTSCWPTPTLPAAERRRWRLVSRC